MTIGTSLFLIAAGAILKFAVTAHVAGIDLKTVGVILMVVGGVGLAIGVRSGWPSRSRSSRLRTATAPSRA
jgi:hypothetical protein